MEVNGKFECQIKLGVISALLGLAWRNLHAICPSTLCNRGKNIYSALHGVYLDLLGFLRNTDKADNYESS
jgi:hypothetical protein